MQGLRVEGLYRQGMAPASASPQPPSGRPDPGGQREPGPDATRGAAPAASESDAPLREGPDPRELAHRQDESYGPLSVERQIKQDGRALILYACLEHPDQ